MKTEIQEILNYLDGTEEILNRRDAIKQLDAQDATQVAETIRQLDELIKAETESQRQGYHLLFLGCAYYEQATYRKATQFLKKALVKLQDSKNNKAVAHWMLSMSYTKSGEYDKARRELMKAEKMLQARVIAIQRKVDAKIFNMFNSPIFAEVPPDPKPRDQAKTNPAQVTDPANPILQS